MLSPPRLNINSSAPPAKKQPGKRGHTGGLYRLEGGMSKWPGDSGGAGGLGVAGPHRPRERRPEVVLLGRQAPAPRDLPATFEPALALFGQPQVVGGVCAAGRYLVSAGRQ